MSGSRQKKLRRQQGLTRNDILDSKIRMRKLMESAVIPSDQVVEYLLSRFVGKTGYHYISVSAYGSLFIHDNYKALVPIILHRDFPTTSSLGRFADPHEKDCVISLVRVDPTFKGIILDKEGTLYSAGIKEPIPLMARIAYICSLGRVSAAEYNGAIQSQEAEYTKRMEEFMNNIKQRTEKLDNIMNNPYADPYDVIDITPNPYEVETPL